MSDTLKNLTDRMIAGLRTQDEWPPLATKTPPVANKNSSISAPVATLATLATEKQDKYFPADFSENFSVSSHPKIDDKISLAVSYKKVAKVAKVANPAQTLANFIATKNRLVTKVANPAQTLECRPIRRRVVNASGIGCSERIALGLCAGCRAPLTESSTALDLADGNRVHLDPDYRCLIAWGGQWRSAARAALARKTCNHRERSSRG